MKQTTKPASPLPPEQAFVVQFRESTKLKPRHWEGRVEHVVSGETASFQSLEELRLFVVRKLAAVRKGAAD